MKTSEICLKAIEVLNQFGWCRQQFQDNVGRCCMVGAIAVADSSDAQAFNTLRIREITIAACKLGILGTATGLSEFNDTAPDKRYAQRRLRTLAAHFEMLGD